MSRVVVIGAGVGGLAAAARLARLGHDVTVVEQAPTVGGKLARHEAGGFRFDTGPSVVTLPATLRDLFVKTGAPLERVLDLVPVEPATRYRFPDGTWVDVPTGVHAASEAFAAALGADAGAQWRAFSAHAARLWAVTRVPFVESPLAGAGTLARLAVRRPRDLVTVAPWRSLRGIGRRHLRDPRLRQYLDRYATYSGSDPRSAPAALAVVPYVEQTFGSWYVPGGLYRLAEAIRERAVERGAVVLTGTAATAIELAAGRVDAVRLADGRRLPADVVVSGIDAHRLYGELLPRPDLLRRIARADPSYSGFVLLLGLRAGGSRPAHHTVLFCADYDAEFDALAAGRVVEDPTLYVSVPADPALAPAGHEAAVVLVNAPRHDPTGRAGVDWDARGTAERYAQRLLGLLAARGYDVADRVVLRAWRTPADLERATGSPGGAIYGSSSNGARAAFVRPANRSPVPGLFLVGGSAHPGGGLPLVTMSAALVAEMVGAA